MDDIMNEFFDSLETDINIEEILSNVNLTSLKLSRKYHIDANVKNPSHEHSWIPLCEYLGYSYDHKYYITKHEDGKYQLDTTSIPLCSSDMKTLQQWDQEIKQYPHIEENRRLIHITTLQALPIECFPSDNDENELGTGPITQPLWIFKYKNPHFPVEDASCELWVMKKPLLNILFGPDSRYDTPFDNMLKVQLSSEMANIRINNRLVISSGSLVTPSKEKGVKWTKLKELPIEENRMFELYERSSNVNTLSSIRTLLNLTMFDKLIAKYWLGNLNGGNTAVANQAKMIEKIIPIMDQIYPVLSKVDSMAMKNWRQVHKSTPQKEREPIVKNLEYDTESDCDHVDDDHVLDYIHDQFDVAEKDFDIEVPNSRNYGLPLKDLNSNVREILEEGYECYIAYRTSVLEPRRFELTKVTIGTAKKDITNLLKYIGYWGIKYQKDVKTYITTLDDLCEILSDEQDVKQYGEWCIEVRENQYCTVANIFNSLWAITIWLHRRKGKFDYEKTREFSTLRGQASHEAKGRMTIERAHLCQWETHVQNAWKCSYEAYLKDNSNELLREAILIGFYSLYATDRVSIIRNLTVKLDEESGTLVRHNKWIPITNLPNIQNRDHPNQDIQKYICTLGDKDLWPCAVMSIQGLQHVTFDIYQGPNKLSDIEDVDLNKQVYVYINNHNTLIEIFKCCGKDLSKYMKTGYWMVDLTDPKAKAATHKNTRWHGYTCIYPCQFVHSTLIETYYNNQLEQLKRSKGVLFSTIHDKAYHPNTWSKYFKSVYSKYLPDDIPCPNPKDFRKVFITYMRRTIPDNSSAESQNIFNGACYIQKHSLTTSRLTYDQERKNRAMNSVMEFTYRVSNNVSLEKQVELPLSNPLQISTPPVSQAQISTPTAIPQDQASTPPVEATITNGVYDEEFIADCIRDERVVKRKKEYLVKWQGYPESQNSWEPASHITDKSLISDFNKQKKNKKQKK